MSDMNPKMSLLLLTGMLIDLAVPKIAPFATFTLLAAGLLYFAIKQKLEA